MKPLHSLTPASLVAMLLAGCASFGPPSFAPGTGRAKSSRGWASRATW